MPVVHVEDGSHESQGGSTGALSSSSWLHGWPLENRSSCQKIPNSSSISELIHPAVCNFNIKNWLGFLKMLAIEIQLVGVLLGFISSRLYKQLVSDIPAFKNSVREPSVIWFVFTAKRSFFNPFGVVGFDTPASRTNEKSSGRVCGSSEPSIPSLHRLSWRWWKLENGRARDKTPASLQELHSMPETTAGMEILLYLIQIKSSYQTGSTGDSGKTKANKEKAHPSNYTQ